jgi:hypothetical protein
MFTRKPTPLTPAPKSPPEWTEILQLLLDMRRRLGRMERDLIDLKIHLRVPRRPVPDEPTIQ